MAKKKSISGAQKEAATKLSPGQKLAQTEQEIIQSMAALQEKAKAFIRAGGNNAQILEHAYRLKSAIDSEPAKMDFEKREREKPADIGPDHLFGPDDLSLWRR